MSTQPAFDKCTYIASGTYGWVYRVDEKTVMKISKLSAYDNNRKRAEDALRAEYETQNKILTKVTEHALRYVTVPKAQELKEVTDSVGMTHLAIFMESVIAGYKDSPEGMTTTFPSFIISSDVYKDNYSLVGRTMLSNVYFKGVLNKVYGEIGKLLAIIHYELHNDGWDLQFMLGVLPGQQRTKIVCFDFGHCDTTELCIDDLEACARSLHNKKQLLCWFHLTHDWEDETEEVVLLSSFETEYMDMARKYDEKLGYAFLYHLARKHELYK